MSLPPLRVVFIGCVQLSYEMLQEVLVHPSAKVVGIISREKSDFHSDFCSLLPVAAKHQIPTLAAELNQQQSWSQWIEKQKADVVYCFGWPYLLKREVLESARLGVVGYHPAELPQNRGRHPLIWAIALGLTHTASTFFFMDENADSGDILHQKTIEIGNADVGELYSRLIPLCRSQVRDFTEKLQNGAFERKPQNHQLANLWRKRSKADGQIDWRMSATSIHNLVRALTRPYVGAHAVFLGQDCKVWRTEIYSPSVTEGPTTNLEPGKVLHDSKDRFVVKCGEGSIRLIEFDFPEIPTKGSYL